MTFSDEPYRYAVKFNHQPCIFVFFMVIDIVLLSCKLMGDFVGG